VKYEKMDFSSAAYELQENRCISPKNAFPAPTFSSRFSEPGTKNTCKGTFVALFMSATMRALRPFVELKADFQNVNLFTAADLDKPLWCHHSPIKN
jgi:hypothetical protein